MAQLAMQGHATRGKEVIEILEMLGGKNIYKLDGKKDLWYILSNATIEYATYLFQEQVYTLDEFEAMFPYKIGDKIIHSDYESPLEIVGMKWENDSIKYEVYTNDYGYWYSVDELQPCKEETMDRKYNVEEYLKVWEETEKGLEVVVNDRFELKEDNGKFYIIKKQPQYPKTYEESCDVLGTYPIYNNPNLCICEWHPETRERHEYYSKLANLSQELIVFMKLLICRDAYWKIAGDWKPDWEDETDIYYTISYDDVNIKCYNNTDVYSKLAFPTEEMRDAFYGNFKELIETCKEFL